MNAVVRMCVKCEYIMIAAANEWQGNEGRKRTKANNTQIYPCEDNNGKCRGETIYEFYSSADTHRHIKLIHFIVILMNEYPLHKLASERKLNRQGIWLWVCVCTVIILERKWGANRSIDALMFRTCVRVYVRACI